MSEIHEAPKKQAAGGKAGAVIIVGGLTMLLLLIFELGGLLDAFDVRVSGGIARMLAEDPVRELPWTVRWIVAALVAFSLPAVMLSEVARWRRVFLWLACTVVMQLWTPVLCLAAYRPQVALVVLASLISGAVVILCARRDRVVTHHVAR